MQLFEKYDGYQEDGLFEEKGLYELDRLAQNINPALALRPYQKEAHARFTYHWAQKEKKQDSSPTHLLYNMATGSGKTLVMALFILSLYEKGYRNFLFFVNSTNVLEKTKDNFINPHSSKYLFAPRIVIGNKPVNIRAVENFELVNGDDINICFTTIQGLQSSITTEKENSVSDQDFKDKKIVFLADESHHLNADTKSKKEAELETSWESTIMRLFSANPQNILLEFTATVPKLESVGNKYKDVLIYKYDLKAFRNDLFSKEVKLLKTDTTLENRMLIACIYNYYRRAVAGRNGLPIKPVILFKSNTKAQSEENFELFHTLIKKLSTKKIEAVLKTDALKPIAAYFEKHSIDAPLIIKELQHTFREEHSIYMNEGKEASKNQHLINSLEEKDNPICSVFAVEKLNEGWDVLNLYDIVRCYENKTDRKETTKEAQLIGRGARYFPFKVDDEQDKYKRKYDGDLSNELRILEEFHYHAQNDSIFISNLNQSLIEQGLFDTTPLHEKTIRLKKSFMATEFYLKGKILINDWAFKSNRMFDTRRFLDMPIFKAPLELPTIELNIKGKEIRLLETLEQDSPQLPPSKVAAFSSLGLGVIRKALSQDDFYTFGNLKYWLSGITSIDSFIHDYLAKIKVLFTLDRALGEIPTPTRLYFAQYVLATLRPHINKELEEKTGTGFKEKFIREIFKEEKTLFTANNADDLKEHLKNKDWYAYDTSILTSEELHFEKLFARFIDKMKVKYSDIYLLRNERFFALYDKHGSRFEPDFVIMCNTKDKSSIIYQCFIEPKGTHLLAKDSWKEKFLLEGLEAEVISIGGNKYKLIGLPFFNRIDGIGENKFEEILTEALELGE